MTVNNPFADSAAIEQEDQNSVLRARAGDRKALEDLIEHHQAWIYNIAQVLPMERAKEAFPAMWEGHTHGKNRANPVRHQAPRATLSLF